MLAQSTVGRNLHLHINIVRIDSLDLQNLKTRLVKEDLLCVVQPRTSKEKADSLDAVDTFYQRAYGLISSPQAREAFDLSKEADA
ncbi:MAG: hypothetical protein ACKPJJ_37400, partial [Planctomycetaceae bacterium]